MQSKLYKILIGIILFIFVVGGFWIWSLFKSGTSTSTTQSGQSSDQYNGLNQTSVSIPSKSQNQQQTLPNIEREYASLFQKILAERIVFGRSVSSAGEGGGLYNLYSNDIADSKKMFPAQTDFSLGVALVDLTDDGVSEGIVFEDLPGFCGTGGCTLDIYQKKQSKWSKLYSLLASGNVGLSNVLTNGYRDLFFTVPGEIGTQSKVVRYTWDGKQYKPGEVVATWNGSTFVTN